MYILSGYNEQKAYCPADYKYAASGSNSYHNLLIEDSLIGNCEARWNCLFLFSCLLIFFHPPPPAAAAVVVAFFRRSSSYFSIFIPIHSVSLCLFFFKQFSLSADFQTFTLNVYCCRAVVAASVCMFAFLFETFFYSFNRVPLARYIRMILANNTVIALHDI